MIKLDIAIVEILGWFCAHLAYQNLEKFLIFYEIFFSVGKYENKLSLLPYVYWIFWIFITNYLLSMGKIAEDWAF